MNATRAVKQARETAQKPGTGDVDLTSLKTSDIKTDAIKFTVQAVLCWSEYYNGKWQPTKTSDVNKPVTLATFFLAGTYAFDRSELILRVYEEGGALVVTVPTQFRSPTYMFFHEWYGDGPPRHVSFFDRKSLTRLLEESGFRVIHCSYNVELQLLLKRLRRKGSAGCGAPVAAGTGGGYREPEQAPGVAVRFAKLVVNGLGGCLGISDELRVIAVNQER